jgi:hypothetical protein
MVNDISDGDVPYTSPFTPTVDPNTANPTYVSITPLIADLINTDRIVLINSSSTLDIKPDSVSLTNTSDGTKTSTLSYVTDVSGIMLDLSSTTRLNVSVTGLLLNGVGAPKDGSLVASTSTGLGWTTISDFLQLDTDRVHNVSSLTAMNVSFSSGVSYFVKPSVILTPDSDGSGQIIPISIDGYLTNASSQFSGFKVLFGSSKLNYFNYLVLPQTNKLIPGTIGGPSAP